MNYNTLKMFESNSQLITSPRELTINDVVAKVECSSLCHATLSAQAVASIIPVDIYNERSTLKRKMDPTSSDINTDSIKTNFKSQFKNTENVRIPSDLVIPIVIQKTVDEKLQAVIPMVSPTNRSSLLESICQGKEEAFSPPQGQVYVDITHEYRNGVVSEDSSSSNASSSSPPLYDSDDQESCISALTADSTPPHPTSTPHTTSSPPTAPKMLLTINPATVTYVLIENVLCAVLPLVTPASYKAALAAGHVNKPKVWNTVPQTETSSQGSSSESSDSDEGDSEGSVVDNLRSERDEVNSTDEVEEKWCEMNTSERGAV